MSELSYFLKKNKKMRSNAFFPATRSLTDAKGEPVLWEIRPLTTAEDERIREECTREVPLPGRKSVMRNKIDINLYLAKQMTAAVASPNLFSAELQDSYGVKTPEELLREMVDDPAEYAAFGEFIREHSGFETDMEKEVEEAKNS